MKRVMYSNLFKILVSIVCAACVFMGVYSVTDSFINERGLFAGSGNLFAPLDAVLNSIYYQSRQISNEYANAHKDEWLNPAGTVLGNSDETAQTEPPNDGPDAYSAEDVDEKRLRFMKSQPIMLNTAAINSMLRKYESDINYYISFPSLNLLWTNIPDNDLSIFYSADRQYTHIRSYHNDVVNTYGYDVYNSGLNGKDDYDVYISLKDSYIEAHNRPKNDPGINAQILKLTVLMAVLLAGIIILIAVCGHSADNGGEVKRMRFDKVYTELDFVLIAAVCCVFMMYALFVDSFVHDMLPLYLGAACGVAFILCEFAALSIVRKLKTKTFWSDSLTEKLFKRLKLRQRTAGMIGLLRKDKRGIAFAVLLIVYTICVCSSPILAVLAAATAIALIALRMQDKMRLRKTLQELRNGNAAYRADGCRFPDMAAMAEDINAVGEGMSIAVETGIKAERMKAELITNVSHDLKTPLTSIINYSRLLEELEPEPAEARDYAAVISRKAQQLKKITSDLFDVSKAQSGNAEVNTERLDICLLVRQSMGEMNSEIENSELTFRVKAENELYVMADGRKLSRVFENLIQNMIKYSLDKTRAFIEVHSDGETVTAEFKNISAYPLDFDTDEITERFVRGDVSRSKEGSGLGLAIAKSYTEICGGSFKIITDGDLFKAEIKFKEAE